MVNDISSLINQSTNFNTGAAQGKSSLGKDDFFKLMMAQLKNQSPLDPTDSSKYAAELAQFRSLEQLQNMNDSLTQNINANYMLTQSVNNTLTAALIGKSAKLNSSQIKYDGQSEADFTYKLPSQANTVTVKILDQNGKVVKSYENVPMTAGEHKLSWDFTDNEGNKVSNGDYTFKVEASDMTGKDMTVNSFGYGTIDAVRFTQNGTMLVINGVEYNLSDISEILNSSNPTSIFKNKGL